MAPITAADAIIPTATVAITVAITRDLFILRKK